MKILKTSALAALTAVTFHPDQATAHATLEQQEAQLNTTYKGVMRIGHGCEGQPTLRVTITIPEGFINAKPMPKAGWKMTTVSGPYAKTYDYHGPRSEGLKQVTWEGSLDDAHYDEFVVRGYISDAFAAGQTLYFPTVQECADGAHEWVNIPAAGQDPHALDSPAPGVRLTAGEHAHH
ncbi:DUF1775 domain-containing protein [Alphaproteobacteria bacterium KMM 3653]|uniref:DUF1775 domain-containing protein n=1 Tax=Harenicola maris TaxID=2841044 RepID=A0AAP2G2X8_9RHOB|nr:DUF1775 domain-containing protein [Harenicola maris]